MEEKPRHLDRVAGIEETSFWQGGEVAPVQGHVLAENAELRVVVTEDQGNTIAHGGAKARVGIHAAELDGQGGPGHDVGEIAHRHLPRQDRAIHERGVVEPGMDPAEKVHRVAAKALVPRGNRVFEQSHANKKGCCRLALEEQWTPLPIEAEPDAPPRVPALFTNEPGPNARGIQVLGPSLPLIPKTGKHPYEAPLQPQVLAVVVHRAVPIKAREVAPVHAVEGVLQPEGGDAFIELATELLGVWKQDAGRAHGVERLIGKPPPSYTWERGPSANFGHWFVRHSS